MSKVEVSVVNGRISVDHEKLSMVGKGRNAPIQWIVKTSGWSFPRNGIVIQDNDGEFTSLEVAANGKKFTCVDRNSDARSYKYDVNLTDGRNTLTLDPLIQNGSE